MAVVLLREAGNVDPMAVLKPLSGILAGKRADSPLSAARVLLTIRFWELRLSIDLLDIYIYIYIYIYSPSCFIDVENEVFEFDGQQLVFDNSAKQLTAKAPGGDVADVAPSKFCSTFSACADE